MVANQRSAHAMEVLASEATKALFQTLQIKYDYVIVDLKRVIRKPGSTTVMIPAVESKRRARSQWLAIAGLAALLAAALVPATLYFLRAPGQTPAPAHCSGNYFSGGKKIAGSTETAFR